jgi:hypothetical protein
MLMSKSNTRIKDLEQIREVLGIFKALISETSLGEAKDQANREAILVEEVSKSSLILEDNINPKDPLEVGILF